MHLTGWWEHSSEMLLHVEMIVSHCSCRYVGWTSMIWISHSTTFSGWSIGLRSCDSWGHFSTMNSLWCSGKQKFWAFVRGRAGCTKIRDSNADSLYFVQELHWEKRIRSTRGSLGVRRAGLLWFLGGVYWKQENKLSAEKNQDNNNIRESLYHWKVADNLVTSGGA